MSNEKNDINRTIFQWLHPDKCWHSPKISHTLNGANFYHCWCGENCDHRGTVWVKNPYAIGNIQALYTDHLGLVHEAELKFIEERGWKAYYLAMVPQSNDTVNLIYEQVQHITAPASVRATAIAKALEEK